MSRLLQPLAPCPLTEFQNLPTSVIGNGIAREREGREIWQQASRKVSFPFKLALSPLSLSLPFLYGWTFAYIMFYANMVLRGDGRTGEGGREGRMPEAGYVRGEGKRLHGGAAPSTRKLLISANIEPRKHHITCD